MKNYPSRSRMPLMIIGFLIVVVIVFVVNHFMVKKISQTEKQIQYFKTQSGMQQDQMKDLSLQVNAPKGDGQTGAVKKVAPRGASPQGANGKDEIIYEPALDSVILVQ